MATCWLPFQHVLARSCWETAFWESIDCHRFHPGAITRGNSQLEYLWNSSPATSRGGESENKWRVPLLGGGWTDTMIALPWDDTRPALAWERSRGMVLWIKQQNTWLFVLDALILEKLGNFLKLRVFSSINKEVRGENYQPLLKWKGKNPPFCSSFPMFTASYTS